MEKQGSQGFAIRAIDIVETTNRLVVEHVSDADSFDPRSFINHLCFIEMRFDLSSLDLTSYFAAMGQNCMKVFTKRANHCNLPRTRISLWQ